MNSRITGAATDIPFAPTEKARVNLLADAIHITGSPLIDTLFDVVDRVPTDAALKSRLAAKLDLIDPSKCLVLVIDRRWERFGTGFENICRAFPQSGRAERYTDSLLRASQPECAGVSTPHPRQHPQHQAHRPAGPPARAHSLTATGWLPPEFANTPNFS